jgi:RNA polymerase sigma factor (sigma-70 family)
VRLTRDRATRQEDVGEVVAAPICDPGTVTDAVDPAGRAPDAAAAPAAVAAPGADVWVAPTWEQVVRDHSARVYRLAYRLSGNAQDAEDLTQETFVRVFRSLADFSPGTFEGWLHRITTNLFLDMVRRRQRIRFDALPEDTERLPGTAPSPEQVYADTHLDPQVQAALDALSPEFRVAVVLCDIEGLTYEEIAATLGIKLGTVRSRIHRGRVQLREALAHLAPRRGAPASAVEG